MKGARLYGLALTLIWLLSLIASLCSATATVNDSGIEITELTICEVLGPNQYRPRRSNVFYVGEDIGILLKVKAYGHEVGGKYLYNLTFILDVINPLGLVVMHSEKSYHKVWSYSSVEITWLNEIRFDYSSYPFAGQYLVSIKVEDRYANIEEKSETFFILANGLTRALHYKLVETLEVRNIDFSEECRIDRLYLAVIPSLEPYQVVVDGPKFNVKPVDIVMDEHGNTYALFEGLTVRPRDRLIITVSYEVELRALKFTKCGIAQLPKYKYKYPSEVMRYLMPSHGVESDSPEIISIANSVTRGVEDLWGKIHAILKFVDSWLTYDESVPRDLSALEAYHLRRGVCEQYARLFVAMCRAIGIPARVARGFGLLDVEPGVIHEISILHAWAQVYVPDCGWLPIEVQSPRLFGVTPMGHITFVWGEDATKVDSDEVSPTLYKFWYVGGKPEATLSIRYAVEFIPVNITLARNETSILLNASSQVLEGQNVKVTGKILPALANIPVNVRIKSPSGLIYNLTVMTNAMGVFEFEFEANESGSWVIKAWWDGNAFYYGSQGQIEVNAVRPAWQIEIPFSHLELLAIGVLVLCVCICAILVLTRRRRESTPSSY